MALDPYKNEVEVENGQYLWRCPFCKAGFTAFERTRVINIIQFHFSIHERWWGSWH